MSRQIRLIEVARQFSRATIALAVERSKVACEDDDAQVRFASEFFVVCRMGFGLIIAANPSAKSIMDGVDEEFSLFDPQYLGLLEERPASQLQLWFPDLATPRFLVPSCLGCAVP